MTKLWGFFCCLCWLELAFKKNIKVFHHRLSIRDRRSDFKLTVRPPVRLRLLLRLLLYSESVYLICGSVKCVCVCVVVFVSSLHWTYFQLFQEVYIVFYFVLFCFVYKKRNMLLLFYCFRAHSIFVSLQSHKTVTFMDLLRFSISSSVCVYAIKIFV